MQNLEKQLDDLLVKKSPIQIPEGGRRGIVNALPWITLIGGILMLWFAWSAWQLISWADRWTGVANQLDSLYGTGYVAPVSMSPLLWVSLGVLIVEAVLFFIAFPALKAHKKSGWNILFWVALINVVESIVQSFAYNTFGSIISAIISSLIGLYLLFQVRAYYTGEKSAAAPVPGTTTTTTTTVKESVSKPKSENK